MKIPTWRLIAAVAFVAAPAAALAANVDLSAGITVPMGKNYSVNGQMNSVTLSNSSLTATLLQNETITVTSPDTTKLVFDSSVSSLATQTCGSTYSVAFTNSSSATTTITLTPTSTSCSSTSSGGSGGGGGGGGGAGGIITQNLPQTSSSQAPVPTPTPVAAAAPQPFGIISNLAFGSRGLEVSQLQAYLASDAALYPEGLITGYFGRATENAVKRFQKKYGLPAIGKVGPLTRVKLEEVFGKTAAPAPAATPTPEPTAQAAVTFVSALAVGSQGDEVQALQSALAKDPEVYPEGKVTGYFGPATRRAVERFQKKYGIARVGELVYGRVGPKTRAKLNELYGGGSSTTPAPPSSTSNTTQQSIEQLQAQIKALQDQLKQVQGQ